MVALGMDRNIDTENSIIRIRDLNFKKHIQ